MKDLVSILIAGFGITGLIGGIIASAFFAPSLSIDRRQWLKRSVLSSFILESGIFVFILSMDAENLLGIQGKAPWNSILVILEYFLLGGILLTLLNYARILGLENYTKTMDRLIKK